MGDDKASISNLVRIGRELTVDGQLLVVRLELPVWQALEEVCRREGMTIEVVVTGINRTRGMISLPTAIDRYLTGYFRDAAVQDRPYRGLSEGGAGDSTLSKALLDALDVIGAAPKRDGDQ